MTVTVEKPKIITLLYRQEKPDADYGSCLWARFYLDTTNYTLFIESDCGDYSHGWTPTPTAETFLHLLCRVHGDYLLHKLACKTVVDSSATWVFLKELVKATAECENAELQHYEWSRLKQACFDAYDADICHVGIVDALKYTALDGKIDEFDIYECIQTDFDCGAKKIVSVFLTAIVPVLKEMEDRQ